MPLPSLRTPSLPPASARDPIGGVPSPVPVAHIGLVALGLVAATSAVAGRAVPGPMLAAAALGAWTVYAALRLLDADGGAVDGARSGEDPAGARWTWVALALLATVAAVGRLPRAVWAVAGLVALPALVDVWRRMQPARAADAWAKPVLVALGWTGGAVGLPLASMAGGWTWTWTWTAALGGHAAAVALAVAANVLVSDAADRDADARVGRVTVATRRGSRTARALGAVLATGGAACALASATAAGLEPGATAALVAAPVCVGLLGTLVPPVTPARRVAVDLAVGLGGLALLLR